MKCVNCASPRHRLHICSLSSLHLWFSALQSQLNVWKGTLRVDGGPLPFERLTESFVKRERPWIYCTHCIRMFNPMHSTRTHTHVHQLPLQCTPWDLGLMELQWDRVRQLGRSRQRGSLFNYGEAGRGLHDIISMSSLTSSLSRAPSAIQYMTHTRMHIHVYARATI